MHDELVSSCPPEEAYDYAIFLVNQLEKPRYYLGNKLVVPATVTVARHWGDSEFEFKRMPDRKQFEEVCHHVYSEVSQ